MTTQLMERSKHKLCVGINPAFPPLAESAVGVIGGVSSPAPFMVILILKAWDEHTKGAGSLNIIMVLNILTR